MPTLSTKPEPDVVLEGEEECYFPCWKTLPDHIFLHIFSYLDASSLNKTGLVCKAWLRVAFDELLWKDLFYRHWQISRSISMAPGKYSWVQEYKRLLYHTPSVESEVLKQHADQVLHVSFSHNGKMFATCSKDGFIRVWDTAYPTSLKYKADMRKFTWKYTQFSQFNSSDTLLLVSGVHFGSLSTSGEIAVFNLEGEFVMQSRVMNKPYDVFGTWYNDCYLLSGNLHWTGHLNSCSAIWLNKAYQETTSEEESVVMRLFKFSNINASSIRTIMVSKCLSKEGEVTSLSELSEDGSTDQSDVTLAGIGGDTANQDAECTMDETVNPEENLKPDEQVAGTSGEGQKKKTAKNVQSIQVFENGSFITKFLEVDDDEPNNKLNGTIEYSSDYRMAEEPDLHSETLLNSDSSGSDMSERSSNGTTGQTEIRASSADMEISKSSRPDMEDIQNVVPIHYAANDGKSLAAELDDITTPSTQPPVHDIPYIPFSSKNDRIETECVSDKLETMDNDNVKNDNFEEIVCMDANESEGVETEVNEKVDTVDIADSDSVAKKAKTVSQKRVLHTSSEMHECRRSVSGKDDFDRENTNSEGNPKLAFCCVDYKKPKRMFTVAPAGLIRPIAGTSRSCAQSTICSGSGKQSDEILEVQSSSSEEKVDCLPIKPLKCNIVSETSTLNSFVTSEVRDKPNELDFRSQLPNQLHVQSNNHQKSKCSKIGDKYLIFTKGSKTYTPHQIGIKRIKPLKAFSADGTRLLPNVAENTHNMDQGQGQGVEVYDDVDHLIDMHGHIIGMALSPDHRYLYVNSRPWPKNYHIENPLYPPPIAQEIDIHVIDLLRMREVGTMHRSHKAYTSNDECFFIFLDVCEEYVASGAEDKHGYLWDRHYGLCLHKYPHSDVVNSVAFNPSDPEVLVTVSDDFSIKIWRSHSREKEVVKAFNKEHCVRLKHVQDIKSDMQEYTDTSTEVTDKT